MKKTLAVLSTLAMLGGFTGAALAAEGDSTPPPACEGENCPATETDKDKAE